MKRKMRILVVEDDLTSRKMLAGMLKEYGECDVAVDGDEAVNTFKAELKKKDPYDLICLDIMMPKKNGQDVLRIIRSTEKKQGINKVDAVKVIMTTSLNDNRNIIKAFNQQCGSYIVKPVKKQDLITELENLELI